MIIDKLEIFHANQTSIWLDPHKGNFLTDHSKAVLLLWILFVVCVSCLSVILSCMFFAAFWSPAGKGLAFWFSYILCFFFCVFVAFPYGVLGWVWYLIVSIQDLCLLPYLGSESSWFKRDLSPTWNLDIKS